MSMSIKEKYQTVQRIAESLFVGNYDIRDLENLEALILERTKAQAALYFAAKNKQTGAGEKAAKARLSANTSAIESWLSIETGRCNEDDGSSTGFQFDA